MCFRVVYSIRGRLVAWILHVVDEPCHKTYGGWKQRIFEDVPDMIVELGPGTGANCRYYRRGTVLTAIEPNPMMYYQLYRNAEEHGINLDIREIKADKLDICDESAEVVVSTLLLCYVDNQTQVLNEVYRILRPGGRFLFMEHVAAPKGTFLRRFQGLINKPWQWCLEGCKLNCDTESALRKVGFSKIELEHFELNLLIPLPIKHHIAGIATK